MADSSRTALPLSAVGHIKEALSALIRGELTSKDVTDALGYTPPQADTNTTYGLSISGHTVSLVEGGGAASVTVPDSDTTALGSMTGTLGLGHGGTGATTAQAARAALGAMKASPTWGDLAGRTG